MALTNWLPQYFTEFKRSPKISEVGFSFCFLHYWQDTFPLPNFSNTKGKDYALPTHGLRL